MKHTSAGLFYIQFLPIDPFPLNLTHWTFKEEKQDTSNNLYLLYVQFPQLFSDPWFDI